MTVDGTMLKKRKSTIKRKCNESSGKRKQPN